MANTFLEAKGDELGVGLIATAGEGAETVVDDEVEFVAEGVVSFSFLASCLRLASFTSLAEGEGRVVDLVEVEEEDVDVVST